MPILGLGANTQLGIGIAIALEDRFTSQAKRVATSLQNLKDKSHDMMMSSIRDARGRYAAVATGAGFATLGMYNVSKEAASFEHQLRQIEIVGGRALGKTREELAGMAFDISKAYGIDNRDVASAMFENIKAGLRTNLKDITNYQVAVATVAGEALEGEQGVAMGLINIMNSMKLNTSEFPRIANAVVAAANASTASVYNLNEAMQYFSNTAHVMGMNLEETLALISKLSNSGIKGSAAGTALNNALTQLSKSVGDFAAPSKTKAWAAIGLNPKDIAALVNGGQGGILDMIDLVQKATAGLSRTDRIGILNTLFNVRGQRGMINLFGYDEQGNEVRNKQGDPVTFRQLLKEIQGGVKGDITKTQAEAMADDFWVDIKKAGIALRELGYEFYNAIRPILRVGFKVFTKAVNAITWIASTPLGKVLGGLLAVVIPSVAIFAGLRAAAAAATLALSSFATMMRVGGFSQLLSGGLGSVMGRGGWFGNTPTRSRGFAAAFNSNGKPYVPKGHFINLGGKLYQGGNLLPTQGYNWKVPGGGAGFGQALSNAIIPGLMGASAMNAGAAAGGAGATMSFLGRAASWLPRIGGIALRFIPYLGILASLYSVGEALFSLFKSDKDERKRAREPIGDLFYQQLLSQDYFGGLENRRTYLDDMKDMQMRQTININVNGQTQSQELVQKALSQNMENYFDFTLNH